MQIDTVEQANDNYHLPDNQSPPSFSLLPRQFAVLQSNSPNSCNSEEDGRRSRSSSISNSSNHRSPGSISLRKRRVYSVNGPLSLSSREAGLEKCDEDPSSPVIESQSTADNYQRSPLVRPIMTLSNLTIRSPKPANQASNILRPCRSPFVNYSGSSAAARDYNPSSISCDSPSPRKVPITVISSTPDRSAVSISGGTTPMDNSSFHCNNTLTPNKVRLPIFSSPLGNQTPVQQRSTPKTPISGTFRLSPRIGSSPIRSPKPLMPMFQANNLFSSPRTTPSGKNTLSPRISPSVASLKSPACPEGFNHLVKAAKKDFEFKSPNTGSNLIPRFLPPTGKNSPLDDGSQEDECFMGVQMDGLLRGFGNHQTERRNVCPPYPRDSKTSRSRPIVSLTKENGNVSTLPCYDSLLSDDGSNDSVNRGNKDTISDPPIHTLSLERRTPSKGSQNSTPRVTPSMTSPTGNQNNCKSLSILTPTTDRDNFDDFFGETNKHHSPYDSDGSLSDIDDDNDNFFLSSPCVVAEEKNEAADNLPTSASSFQRHGRAAKQRKIEEQQPPDPDTQQDSVQTSQKAINNNTFEAVTSAASLYGMDIIQEHSISNVSLVEMNRIKTRRPSGVFRSKVPILKRDLSDSSLSAYGLNLEDSLLYEDSSRDLVTPPIVAQTQTMLSPPPIRETDLTTFRVPPDQV